MSQPVIETEVAETEENLEVETPEVDEEEEETLSPAEIKALKSKLKKANDEAKNHRLRADELARKGETDLEAAARQAREEAAAEEQGRWKPLFIKSEAKRALAEAGCLITPDRALALLDLADVDVDPEDGTVVGLDTAIRKAKKENQDFFGKRNAAQINAGDRDAGAKTQPKSAAERHALKLTGGR